MARLLFIALIVLGVYLIVRSIRGGNKTHSAGKIDTRTLRQCALCGTFLPENEAVRDRSGFFCSQAHRDEHHRSERNSE